MSDIESFLFYVVQIGNLNEVKRLIISGADINTTDENGMTLLHWAAWAGHTDICKFLLDNGADINVRCKKGWTPLHWATFNGHIDTCKLLIDAGADPYLPKNDGETAMDLCRNDGLKEYIKQNYISKTLQAAGKQIQETSDFEWEY